MDYTDTPPAHNFPGLPPFPDDVPTAPLLRLSLQKILEQDKEEFQRLYKACTELGFFYLDIRDASGQVQYGDGDNENATAKVVGNDFLHTTSRLFEVAEEFFALPVEEKVKYDFKDQGSYFGYKGYGAGVIDKEGTTDRTEFYNTSKDDILALSAPLPRPAPITTHKPLLKAYISTSHAIVTALLSALSTLLHLPLSNPLPTLHKLTAPSGDQVRFVRSPPQPPQDRRTALGAHTDFGSVTLLFNRLGGLQILPPPSSRAPSTNADAADTNANAKAESADADAWLYVRPLPGHCIVNLGDALVKFSRGVLRSNTHRVVNPPGEAQGACTRLSLVYFARPNDEVVLRALEGSDVIDAVRGVVGGEEKGEGVTAKEWVLRRALGRRGVGRYEDSEGTEGMRGLREVRGGGVAA